MEGLSHIATALCYWESSVFSLSLLLTDGEGPAVRLWNRCVTSHPTAVLGSHHTTVVDVVIQQALAKIFSYSKDAVKQGSLPPLLNLTVLLVTCREYLAVLHLHETESNSRSGIYTCVLYNPHLQQVITACADSTLTVWDVKTGIKKIQVWNLLNGLNLHKLETVSNSEVTGIICHHENQLLATGWRRLIAQYGIAFSKQTCRGSPGYPGHGSLSRSGTSGRYDGEIIIWSLALQKPITRLQTTQQEKSSSSEHELCRVFENGTVLLSSPAVFFCWWSICGPRHNHGQFYAPDEFDKSVMGLSTNLENSLLVTGDTTGSIKVWDVSLEIW
ncbi:hypothetical protein cypCar_00028631, partial [Cyprinus carpio]